MGLKKDFTQGKNSGNYWRVDGLELISLPTTAGARVFVALYKDQATAGLKDARPAIVKTYKMPADVITKKTLTVKGDHVGEDPYKAAYTHLKTLPDFDGAKDV